MYGSEDENAGTQVRDFHHHVKGDLPGTDGKRYHALDPDTYFWAHATFVEQVLYFADTFVKRLTESEKEQIYLESKTWYRRYGVSDRPMPATYAEFEKYWDHMMEQVLVAHPSAKYGVGYVTKGFPKPKAVHPLVWRLVAPVFNPLAAFLTTGGLPDPRARGMNFKTVAGGFLVQSRDTAMIDEIALNVVTERAPTDRELEDMKMAFAIAKHVKSNAIVYVKDGQTAGIGAGQMSRIDSARIAGIKAEEAAKAAGWPEPMTRGSAVASEAFFPFADGLLSAVAAGATAVIQPGGSIRDQEVIDAANANGVAMVFTGVRTFRH